MIHGPVILAEYINTAKHKNSITLSILIKAVQFFCLIYHYCGMQTVINGRQAQLQADNLY